MDEYMNKGEGEKVDAKVVDNKDVTDNNVADNSNDNNSNEEQYQYESYNRDMYKALEKYTIRKSEKKEGVEYKISADSCIFSDYICDINLNITYNHDGAFVEKVFNIKADAVDKMSTIYIIESKIYKYINNANLIEPKYYKIEIKQDSSPLWFVNFKELGLFVQNNGIKATIEKILDDINEMVLKHNMTSQL